jgi:hypothetical protein
MRFLRRFLTRLANFAARRQNDERLREEMEEHLALQTAENLHAGMPPAEARRQAVLKFGAREAIREDYQAEQGLPLIENVLQDTRFASRQLRKASGFTLTAVLTLALGIGALTTIATWTNAVLYNPRPHVAAPRELRFIDATVLGNQGYSVHYDQYRFVRESGGSWKDAIAFAKTSVNLTDPSAEPQAITAGVVSSNYFWFLGLRPQSGRFFQPNTNDRAYGANDEIVLSDALWHDRFNANPSIVGCTLSINQHPFTVVGIAPADFAGIFGGVAEAAWIPLSGLRDLSADSVPDPLLYYGLQVAVRLRPGARETAAAAEVHTLARAFALQRPGSNLVHWDLNLRAAAHFQRGLFRTIGEQLPVLLGASVLLMVLVCINIASLLGQHAARRRHEVAIRTALGATPARIAAQVLAETGLLAHWWDGQPVPVWHGRSTYCCPTSVCPWPSTCEVTRAFCSSSPLSPWPSRWPAASIPCASPCVFRKKKRCMKAVRPLRLVHATRPAAASCSACNWASVLSSWSAAACSRARPSTS